MSDALLRLHETAPLRRVAPWPRAGLCFVLSSPSGGGKTTITRNLLELDEGLSLSVSATTRPPRKDEEEGRHYHFLEEQEFARREAEGWFLETAEVFGHRYGTPRGPVEKKIAEGGTVLFDIDWQGAAQMRAGLGDAMASVFLLPPSFAELESRLHRRAQDSRSAIDGRLQGALAEIARWSDYDYVLVNHDLDETIGYVRAILTAERLRRARQTGAAQAIAELIPQAASAAPAGPRNTG